VQSPTSRPKPRHTGRNIHLIALAVLLGLCGLIGGIAGAITSPLVPHTPVVRRTERTVATAGQCRTAQRQSWTCGQVDRRGDDVVHVGQDIPAGTG